MTVLAHEGCPELERIGHQDYVFPGPSELKGDTAKVQTVKKLFFASFGRFLVVRWPGRPHSRG